MTGRNKLKIIEKILTDLASTMANFHAAGASEFIPAVKRDIQFYSSLYKELLRHGGKSEK